MLFLARSNPGSGSVLVGVNTLFLIPGEVGGSEVYLCETLLALRAEHPEASFVLFTNRENDRVLRERFQDAGQVDFVALDFAATNRPVRIAREQTTLPQAIARAKPEVVWSPGYTAPILTRRPQVVSVLDVQYKSHPEDFTRVARLATDLLVRSACWRARRIIAISEFSKREIVERLRVDARKVHVTPLAANPAFAARPPESELRSVRRSILGDETTPFILSVAHSYPHKNLAALVEAFGALSTAIPHHLVALGKPRAGESAVQSALARLPSPERAHRLESVSRPELIALLHGADVFVHPSLYEGFGLPVLEAMTAGAPVIAANRASLPEVGGDAVLYFDAGRPGALAGAIRSALELSETDRQRRVLRGRMRAAGFSWRRTAQLTMDCFRSALGKAAPAGEG
jgi:glycosyltransferase involved in cell wall biosynthesis